MEIPASTIAPSTPPSGRRHNGDCLSTPPAPSERSFYPVAIPSFNSGTTKYPTSSAPSVIRNILGKTTFVSQSRFNSDFQCLSILGQGSSGIVYKVLSRLDGCLYAVKMSKVSIKGEAIRSSTLREVHALSSLSNRSDIGSLYIVRYHQAWIEDSRLFFQTELCETSLRDELQKHKQESASIQITENQAYKIFRDLSLALEFIHRQGVVHLDIKPENVFLKDEKYKLGDFGLASKAGGRAADEGDSRYLPLEMLSDDVTIDLTKVSSMRLPVTHYNTTHLIRPFSLV
jgi:serine/threonine protein kinase